MKIVNRTLLFTVLSALTLVACGHQKGGPAESPGPLSQGATLDVNNLGFIACDLFVLHDGIRDRVGTVLGARSGSFHLRSTQLSNSGTIRLIAHPIGSTYSYTSDAVVVHDGQSIEWTLADDLNRSFVAVY